ncbi:hypothetical protein [Streptomyces phage phiScoe44]|nr:hypothetical protein [Streptomyces phage phiScoe44]
MGLDPEHDAVMADIKRTGAERKRLCLESDEPCEWHKPSAGHPLTQEGRRKRLEELPSEVYDDCPGARPIQAELDQVDQRMMAWLHKQ